MADAIPPGRPAVYRGARARWAMLLLIELVDYPETPCRIGEGQWRFRLAPTPWDDLMRLPTHIVRDDEDVIAMAECEAACSRYDSLDGFIAARRPMLETAHD